MDKKNKRALSFLFLIVSLAIFAYSFLLKNSDGKTKIEALNEKNQSIVQLNTEVQTNDADIKDLADEVVKQKSNLKYVKDEAERSKRFLSMIDLELHIPSFLVDLDLKAKELDVDLIIKLNEKALIEDKNKVDEIIDDLAEDDEEIDEEEDLENLEEKLDELEANESEEELEEDEEQGPDTINYNHDGVLHSIDQLSIPIEVKGTYNNVRSFLNYIDTLDAIDSRYIDLESDGKTISGDIILHVFYKGVRK